MELAVRADPNGLYKGFSAVTIEGLPSSHDKELDLLRSNFRRRVLVVALKVAAGIAALLIVAVFAALLFIESGEDPAAFIKTVTELTQLGAPWARELASGAAAYHQWLAAHGTQTELFLFEVLTVKVGAACLTAADGGGEALGWFSSLSISLYSGALRLLFILLASFRLWFAIITCAVVYGFTKYEPYLGSDVLGQTGNGRVFYSGIRAGLDQLSSSGAPDVQLRGLACPQQATAVEARASDIWGVVGQFNADCPTNEALTAIIVKNGDTAAYVAMSGEEALLDSSFRGGSILENTPHLLRAALSLHACYASNELIEERHPDAEATTAQQEEIKISIAEHAARIRLALHSVLTPEMRRCIGQLSASEIATVVLALESGKVLAYAADGDRWTRRSNFVHLNARAVLHSLSAYPEDYSFESRATIRRGLIYASRRSPFAPVRMPLDMSKQEWAIRQWSEVLLALPHEISTIAEEVELAGLIREGHERWNHEFFDRCLLVSPTLTSVSYVTPHGLLFVPFAPLMEVLMRSVKTLNVERLHSLAASVSSRQQRILQKAESSEGGLPTFDRVLPPLTDAEVSSLTQLHGLERSAVQAWSALRLILNGYSWLGRRVGDYTVPDSSIIFAVFSGERSMPGLNALGLLGKTGMIPLRGGKLLDRLGPSWSSRFISVSGATMAETQDDFEKLMQGIKDRDEGLETTNEPLVGA